MQPFLCVPTLHLTGKRSCLVIGWCHSGPHPKATNCQWGIVNEVTQPIAVERSLWGGEGCKSWILAFCWAPPPPSLFLALRPMGELGGPRNRLGPVSCRVSEPSPRSLTSIGPGFEAVVNLSLIPVSVAKWQLQSSWVPVCGTWLLPHPYLGGLKSLRASWVELLAHSEMTMGQGLRTCPWGCCQLRSASF